MELFANANKVVYIIRYLKNTTFTSVVLATNAKLPILVIKINGSNEKGIIVTFLTYKESN